MTRYNCGGPDSPGGTHFEGCDCRAEALRREGAEAERRDVLAWFKWCAHRMRDAAANPPHRFYPPADKIESWATRYDDIAECIALGQHEGVHLRGENERDMSAHNPGEGS